MTLDLPVAEIMSLINQLESNTCAVPASESLHVTPRAAADARSEGIELKRVGNLPAANQKFIEMFRLQDSICSDALWSWAKVMLLAKDFEHAQLLMHMEFANNNRGIVGFNPFEWMNLHLNLPELDVNYLFDGSKPGYELYNVSYFDDPQQLVDRILEYGGNDDYWRRNYTWSAEDYAEFIRYYSPLAILALDDKPYLWTDDPEEEIREFYDKIYAGMIDGDEDTRQNEEPKVDGPASAGSSEGIVASPRLVDQIEKCFYFNARCIGNCVFIGLVNDQDQWYPEQFCDFLFRSAGMLSEDLAKLLETAGGQKARWLYPDDFWQVFQQEPSQDYNQYIVDVGKSAFFKEAGRIGAYDRYPGAYLRTTDMAINRCLTLLRVAMEENAEDVTSLLLDDMGYMLGIASHYLLIQLFLRRMHRTNDSVFIPDKYLDPDDSANRTTLRLYDQDINEATRMVYVPDQLHAMWIQDDMGAIATGHVEFMGMQGTILRVTDQQVPKYFDTIAKNFVKGIAY